MTGGQFQNLLSSTGCFQPVHNCTMVFINKNGKPIHVNSQWHRKSGSWLDKISISLYYHTDKSVWVDFVYCEKNLYASHKLEDLGFKVFITEVNKFLKKDLIWQNWMLLNNRDFIISEILS